MSAILKANCTTDDDRLKSKNGTLKTAHPVLTKAGHTQTQDYRKLDTQTSEIHEAYRYKTNSIIL